MTKILKIDEMVQTSHKVNESYNDETYLDFFGNEAGMGELYKFDKLCPDIDYTGDDLKEAMYQVGVNEKIWKSISNAYYVSIFNKFKDYLIDNGEITEEESEMIEMDTNPIEFHIGDVYFETINGLMDIINKKRAGYDFDAHDYPSVR